MKKKCFIAWWLIVTLIMGNVMPAFAADGLPDMPGKHVVTAGTATRSNHLPDTATMSDNTGDTGTDEDMEPDSANQDLINDLGTESGEKGLATPSNPAMELIDDMLTVTTFYEWNDLIDGVPDMGFDYEEAGTDYMLATQSNFPRSRSTGGYYGSQLTSELASSYYQLLVNYYNGVLSGQEASQEISLGEVGSYEDAEDVDAILQSMGSHFQFAYYQAIYAFRYDYPELFWDLNVSQKMSTSYTLDNSTGLATGTVTATFILESDLTTDEINQMQQELENQINNLVVSGSSRYDQLKAIHDFLCETTDYDDTLTAPYSHSAYGALVLGSAVCEGYSKAFKSLCDRYGIPCELIAGEGGSDGAYEPHMWNYVQMEDGQWYAVDTTWDDQQSGTIYACFLVGSGTEMQEFNYNSFSSMHREIPPSFLVGNQSFMFYYPGVRWKEYDLLLVNTVSFADGKLKQAIIDEGYDRNDDGELSIEEMEEITRLNISNREISDLNGLEYAKYLSELYASGNQIKDFPVFQSLKYLYFLSLDDNEIEDISFLKNPKNLETISLRNNQILEIPNLSSWTENLLYYANENDIREPKNIFFGNTNLTIDKFIGKFSVELTDEWLQLNGFDSTIVEIPDEILKSYLQYYDINGDGELSRWEMRQITSISYGGAGIRDLTGLQKADNLQILELNRSSIVSLEPLQNLKNLTTLVLTSNKIEDITPLCNMKQLRNLTIRNNQITSIPNLTGLVNLRLYDQDGTPLDVFSGNQLERDSFIGKFAIDLTDEWLELNAESNNRVINFPDEKLKGILLYYDLNGDGEISVNEAKDISHISQDYAEVQDLTGLEELTNLDTLILKHNKINSLSPLKNLKSLKYLELMDSEIEDISTLSEMHQLNYLNLQNNMITELPDLTNLKNLQLYWGTDEKENPINIFGGNYIPKEGFSGKFAYELTEAWLTLNSYDGTEIKIPDYALKLALLQEYDRNSDGIMSKSEMEAIENLYISARGITDITGLDTAVNLGFLDMSSNEVVDLMPLSGLKELYYLNASYNQIMDISPVQSITNLSTLELRWNGINLIPDLTSLLKLDLYYQNWHEDGSVTTEPRAMFTGNLVGREEFNGKFVMEMTEEWLELNSYDETIVEFADETLKNVLISQGYDLNHDGVLVQSEMYEIRYLYIGGQQVKSLSGLEAAKNLVHLYAELNEIEDISILKDLTKLEAVSLQNNKIHEIPDLSSWSENMLYYNDENGGRTPRNIFGGNPELTEDKFVGKFSVKLSAEWLQVNSYDPTIVEVPDEILKSFLVSSYDKNGDGELSRGEMYQINHISFGNMGIRDLTGLQEAVNLYELELNKCAVASLEPLQNLKNLTTLTITGNKIEDISPLGGMKQLCRISLRNNQIAEIPDLTGLANLELYDGNGMPLDIFSGNKLTKDSFAGKFAVDLTEEWLELNSGSDDRIVNIPDAQLKTILITGYGTDLNGDGEISVNEAKDIFHIWSEYANVQDLTGLEEFINLDTLTLNNSKIRSIVPLANLKNLIQLNLNNNEIEDVSALSGMTQLNHLELINNNITELPDLTGLTNLQLYGWTEAKESPYNIFGGNYIPREGFAGKFTRELTEEWLNINSYDATPVEIPDVALKMALLQNLDRNSDGMMSKSEMERIESLYISGRGIADLSGLEMAVNLQYLDISSNSVVDLSPLANSGKLFSLNASYNQISNLEPITGISSLVTLEVNNNLLSSVPDMTQMTSLALYYDGWGPDGMVQMPNRIFSGNRILREEFAGKFSQELTEEWLELNSYDPTVVEIPDENLANILQMQYDTDRNGVLSQKEMKDIGSLYGGNGRIEDLTGLEYATNLLILNLNNNKIADLSPLSGLTHLQTLNLADNEITDISALSGMKELYYLDLRGNKIISVPDLTASKNLQLYYIHSVDGVMETKVPRNIFGGNQIERAEFAGKFAEELTEEWLEVNSYDATPVTIPDPALRLALIEQADTNGDGVLCRSEIRQIDSLRAPNQKIKDLTGLDEAVNLVYLNLTGNQIHDIRVLSKLPVLMDLRLGNNQITDISALSSCKDLDFVRLNHNSITDISPLQECIWLNQLDVRSNNIQFIPDFTKLENLELYAYYDLQAPKDIFSGNPELDSRDDFEGKFAEEWTGELTDEWIQMNTYDATPITIPDSNLKSALMQQGIDRNEDGQIVAAELKGVTKLKLTNSNIHDLTGLEHATNLQNLDVSNNQLDSLDVLLECDELLYLFARNNKLTMLPDFWEAGIWMELYSDEEDSNGESNWIPLDMFSGNQLTSETLERVFGYYSPDDDWYSINACDWNQLATPRLTDIVAFDDGSITVDWKKSRNAEGYYIYRKTADSDWKVVATADNPDIFGYIDENLVAGTAYTYTVRAYRTVNGVVEKSGFDPVGLTATALKHELGTVVLGNAVAQDDGSILINWTAEALADGYYVFRKVEGSDWKVIATLEDGTIENYTDCATVGGTAYTYTVRGYELVGETIKKGGFDAAGISTQAKKKGLGTVVLGGASAQDDGSIVVSWTAEEAADGYYVFRKTAGSDWKVIATIEDRAAERYTDNATVGGTAYTYTVRGYELVDGTVKKGGFDAAGVSAEAKKRGLGTVVLKAAEAQNDGSITVSWIAEEAADGYYVFRKTAGSDWKVIATIEDQTAEHYTDQATVGGTGYTYTVRGYEVVNGTIKKGGFDATGVGAEAKKKGLGTVVLQAAEAQNDGSIIVSWTAEEKADGYYVFRKTAGSDWKVITTIEDRTAERYTDKATVGGTAYTYTVRGYEVADGAIKKGGFDAAGVSAVAKKQGLGTVVLKAAEAQNDGSIIVSWTAEEAADGYYVFRKTSGSDWKVIATIEDSTAESYADRATVKGTVYTYTVRGYEVVNGTIKKGGFDAAGIAAQAK